MPRKLFLLTTIAGVLAVAPLAFAKEAQKDSENFFDIRDEVQEAGDVVQKGADKTVGFFEGLFDDDDDKDDVKFHAPGIKKD